MITEERYHELIKVVNNARLLYIQGALTGISDELYDSYMADIYDYEKYHRAAENSPTQSVNPDMGDSDVTHPVAMLSLLDVFTVDDAKEFLNKHKNVSKVFQEYKLDGLSVQLIYRNGDLVSASTRGDGRKGVERISAAQYITDIPKTIDCKDEVVVRGEVFMLKSRFADYCKKYGKQANPRNTAVGIFKRDSEPERAAYLSCRVFNLENPKAINDIPSAVGTLDTHSKCLQALALWGFSPVAHWEVGTGEKVAEVISEVQAKREAEDIPIDGMVLKLDNLALRDQLGDNGVVPKWAVAYKFPAQEKETRLKGVEWQVGATGKLNPVAILEPVNVMGSTITKATLHNWGRIQELGVQIDDMVVVYKAGDIIPAIKSTRHTPESIPIPKPTVCPACGSLLTGVSELGVCANIKCKEKLLARLNGWTDKKVGNFKGVASSLVTALFEKGKLRIPSDFYKIKPIEIMTLPGSGRAKMNTFMQRIEESKKAMTLSQILVGLGINSLAKAGADEIEAYLRSHHAGQSFQNALAGFMALPRLQIQHLIGNAKGANVYDQIQDPFIQEVIKGVGEVFADRTL
jgi:DNA ligase (NAD+)